MGSTAALYVNATEALVFHGYIDSDNKEGEGGGCSPFMVSPLLIVMTSVR